MFGRGLLKGLGITFKEFISKKVTESYPEVKPDLPENYHGRFVWAAEKCIGCNLCVRACPNKVIEIETKRVEKKRIVTRFVMNIEYCMFCGFCVEACNRDALNFSTEFEMGQYSRDRVPLVMVDTTGSNYKEGEKGVGD